MAITAVRNYSRTFTGIVKNGVTVVKHSLIAIEAASGHVTNLADAGTGGATSTLVHGITEEGVVGLGTAATQVSYIPLEPDVEILLSANSAWAVTDIGKNYELSVATGVPTAYKSGTTHVVVKAIEPGPDTTAYWCRIIPAANTFTTKAVA